MNYNNNRFVYCYSSERNSGDRYFINKRFKGAGAKLIERSPCGGGELECFVYSNNWHVTGANKHIQMGHILFKCIDGALAACYFGKRAWKFALNYPTGAEAKRSFEFLSSLRIIPFLPIPRDDDTSEGIEGGSVRSIPVHNIVQKTTTKRITDIPIKTRRVLPLIEGCLHCRR